jgi:hypothetical protein
MPNRSIQAENRARIAMSTTLPPIEELGRLLYTPVLSDVLDSFGLMRQALRPFVRPLDEALVLLGRVRTGRYATTTAAAARSTIPTNWKWT